MSKSIFFSPGPSQLYPGVKAWTSESLDKDLLSHSHRSEVFKEVMKFSRSQLRLLLNIPNEFEILYFSSATEIWERLIQHFVKDCSLHFVNGSFSERFYSAATALKKNALKVSSPDGHGFDIDQLAEYPDAQPQLIGLIQNETSTGVYTPDAFVEEIFRKFPQASIFIDGVSALPFYQPPFELIGGLYFSVQKGFGLPSGLGVLIARKNLLEGPFQNPVSPHRNFSKMMDKAIINQTIETPNILGIHLLAKVCESMNNKELQKIRSETIHKQSLINQFVQSNDHFSFFVKKEGLRSPTVAVLNYSGNVEQLISSLAQEGFFIGTGYGKYKTSQIRIANFPATTPEDLEMLLKKINLLT